MIFPLAIDVLHIRQGQRPDAPLEKAFGEVVLEAQEQLLVLLALVFGDQAVEVVKMRRADAVLKVALL